MIIKLKESFPTKSVLGTYVREFAGNNLGSSDANIVLVPSFNIPFVGSDSIKYDKRSPSGSLPVNIIFKGVSSSVSKS